MKSHWTVLKLANMHLPESQTRFMDSVQDALRKYDAQLKEINHKVSYQLSKLAYTLVDLRRSGPTQSWHTLSTAPMTIFASSLTV